MCKFPLLRYILSFMESDDVCRNILSFFQPLWQVMFSYRRVASHIPIHYLANGTSTSTVVDHLCSMESGSLTVCRPPPPRTSRTGHGQGVLDHYRTFGAQCQCVGTQCTMIQHSQFGLDREYLLCVVLPYFSCPVRILEQHTSTVCRF